MNQPDPHANRHPLKYLPIVIGPLVLIALLAIAIASSPLMKSPLQNVGDVAARIAPVGGVYAGDAGRAAAEKAAAQPAAAETAAAPAAAAQTPPAETAPAAATQAAAAVPAAVDGKAVYEGLCHACHDQGVAGAPALTDKAAWAPRIAQGEDTLVKHATEGFTGSKGTMLPRGGNPALSDAQIKAAVEWMVSQAK